MKILRLHRLFRIREGLSAVALGAFLAVVVFLSLGSHMTADGQNCLFDQLQNSNCINMSMTEMATFHANAFARFLGGALIPNLAPLLVLFAVVLMLVTAEVVPRHPPGFSMVPTHSPPPVIGQIARWLSLLVSSPPSLIHGRA